MMANSQKFNFPLKWHRQIVLRHRELAPRSAEFTVWKLFPRITKLFIRTTSYISTVHHYHCRQFFFIAGYLHLNSISGSILTFANISLSQTSFSWIQRQYMWNCSTLSKNFSADPLHLPFLENIRKHNRTDGYINGKIDVDLITHKFYCKCRHGGTFFICHSGNSRIWSNSFQSTFYEWLNIPCTSAHAIHFAKNAIDGVVKNKFLFCISLPGRSIQLEFIWNITWNPVNFDQFKFGNIHHNIFSK